MPRKSAKRERRKWSLEDKTRIVAESEQGSVTAAAERNAISPNLLFIWRKLARDGKLGGRRAKAVATKATPAKPAPLVIAQGSSAAVAGGDGRIEIVLANGRRVIVDSSIDAASLSRVLAALEA